jgi:hypothetical protein
MQLRIVFQIPLKMIDFWLFSHHFLISQILSCLICFHDSRFHTTTTDVTNWLSLLFQPNPNTLLSYPMVQSKSSFHSSLKTVHSHLTSSLIKSSYSQFQSSSTNGIKTLNPNISALYNKQRLRTIYWS